MIRLGGRDVIRYGKLATAWAAGTGTVTLTPCISEVDATVTGDADVTVRIFGNMSGPQSPLFFTAAVGNILAYVQAGGINVLLSPPVWRTGYKYQVLQMTTDTTAGWDWVRAHG